jgi:ankyrin repeat protein
MHNQYGHTALHEAAEQGHTAVVTLLLERGADINTTNNVSGIVLVLEKKKGGDGIEEKRNLQQI